MLATFDQWTQGRSLSCLGTNAGARVLPFQTWRHFKEAFAPELVARAIAESRIPVRRCLDPFGGSGTTALACQFLGVHPATIEVNPFLADLIEAKLSSYDSDCLARDLGAVVRRARRKQPDPSTLFAAAPATFLEPGMGDRWIFDRNVAARIAALLNAIDGLADTRHRRLFRVLLGGILVAISNVVVSGKGRRYRRGWQQRARDPHQVDELFCEAARRAISEIHRFSKRAHARFDVIRGDCRNILSSEVPHEIAVFSPPYPNSFDYTDVYNIELWTLGYLNDRVSNQTLRRSTLCSHVQLERPYPSPPPGSRTLDRALRKLNNARAQLWNRWIPAMVGGYFSDVVLVLHRMYRSLATAGSVWMVVGDSRYADVQIDTAQIISDLAPSVGYHVKRVEPFRSMRASPQQGGRTELAETLLVLWKR